MLRIMKWATPLVALGLLLTLGTSRVRAEDKKPDTGKVSGQVVDKDGKPVADAKVRILPASEKKHKGEAKTDRPAPVAEGTTDADGKFTLDNVPAGDYMVQANVKGKGMAREKVEVKAGETADAGKLTLGEVHKKKAA
jgi:uncharacterized GH25 family protein